MKYILVMYSLSTIMGYPIWVKQEIPERTWVICEKDFKLFWGIRQGRKDFAADCIKNPGYKK